MCTLLIANHVYPDCPLFLATNRDEFLDRPAGPFRRWQREGCDLLAPVDKRAGGTWLGINTHGIAAAITNRFGTPPDVTKRSRGELVPMALLEAAAQASIERVLSIDASDFNPFHLLVASPEHASVVWSDGEALHHERLKHGFSLVTEESYGAVNGGREERLRQALESQPSRSRLRELLASNAADGPGARVDIPSMKYGTRSSTLMEWPLAGQPTIKHANASPDIAPYLEVSWTEATG